MENKIKKILRQIISALYPVRCPVCDRIVDETGEMICVACMDKLKLISPPWCMRCGKKVANGEELCRQCKGKKVFYKRGRALFEYESAALSIYRFKYGNRREYAMFFGKQMAEYLGDFLMDIQPDALIPIPLHKKRMRIRGYNQAELLAKCIGENLGIPVRTDLMKREKNTIPQKKLNSEERQNNLKRAFNIVENDVKLEKVVLVDDIYTTGTTVNEAAKVLKESGVKEVYFVTLACGSR